MPPAEILDISDLDRRLGELDERGYTIIPNYLDRATTAEIRAHVDALVDSHLPEVDNVWDRINQPRVIRIDEHGILQLRHPISGATMPRIANNPRTIELGRLLLGSQLADLRLREQVLVRTDHVPPRYGPPAGISMRLSPPRNISLPRARSTTSCCTTAAGSSRAARPS